MSSNYITKGHHGSVLLGKQVETGDTELKAGPFRDLAVHERTNVFSHGEFRSFSILNDHEAEASGSASKSVDAGNLVASTGTTSGSKYRYETALFGTYQAGKGAESGIGVSLEQRLADDAVFEAGFGTTSDGAYFRITGDPTNGGSREAILDIGGSEAVAVSQADWNIDVMDGTGPNQSNPSGIDLDPVNTGIDYGCRFEWYSFGGITLFLELTDPDAPFQMLTIPVHRFSRAGLKHFETPNMPVFASINNGTQSTDFKIRIGGRRYDILGAFQPNTRTVAADVRENQTVGTSGIIPLISFQRKDEYPTGVENTITSYITEWEVTTGQTLAVAVYSVPSASDLTDSNFGDPSNLTADETSLQVDTSATAMSNAERVSGIQIAPGTANSSTRSFRQEKGFRIPIIRDRPTVVAAENLTGSSATVDSTATPRELL